VRVLITALVFGCCRLAAQEPLFDGRTTAGWVEVTGKPFPEACWKIEDHSLAAFPGAHGNQDIRTVESFGSFEFYFEWKIPAHGNSGVKYLLQKVDEWTNQAGRQARARGPEFQLADDAGPEAAADPRRTSGSLYSLIGPDPHVPTRIGGFNQSRLIVRGNRVEHWLNGVKVVSYDVNTPEVLKLFPALSTAHRRSPLARQNHGTPVWFRNLRIRRLE
jgi:hypothetical protein